MVAAAGGVDQARRIVSLRPLYDFLGLELSPALVEGNPYADRGGRVEVVDDLFPLLAEVGLRFCRPVLLLAREIVVHLPLRAAVAAGHVLPYDHAEFVAVVVPACGLDLYVFAYHVVTQILGLDDVECQRLVRGGCIEAVGPPALIQRAELEYRLVVQLQADDVVGIAADREFTHGRVTFHFVYFLAVAYQAYLHVVEER